jgi:hypothetical protein
MRYPLYGAVEQHSGILARFSERFATMLPRARQALVPLN